MLKMDLSGQVALITGATGQLGRVMTRTLSACGAKVAIHYIQNEAKAQELLREITAAGGTGMIVRGDITKEAEIKAIQVKVAAELGDPDIVIANAVVQYNWTSVLEQPAEDYVSQFESCVLQSVFLAKAFIPAMIRKGKGRFIGINTECAMQNFPNQSAYTAGKRGMDGVYRVLAKEVGEHGITVNQVAPGWTISEQDRGLEDRNDAAYIADVPLKRRGEDQDIANAVAFLASDLAGFITGAYLPVSGGNVMPAI
ncbi:MAG: SDR family oxidoreductase [Paenibacillus sp.]|uniref:SDR family NAD(P)-dependent oxidoreductase n=1 Tax=Paenibacillus sp. TaxID=58172 RepID=UPI0029068736|nr:SDR family oxidoreductase [Paenibacillus sp.]MDU4695340.1 SDR family oxidoreductase [Paenibacillus sp.]